MTSLAARAQDALAARLRALVPANALHSARTHVLGLADALVPTLSAGDVAWAHAHLAARAKGELRPSRAGTVQAHAAWSSTALVCSAFAPWRGAVPGLRLEERLPIPHGGGSPNLDAVIDTPDALVGFESKLTEHLAPLRPRPWRPAYRRPAMLAALDGGWADVFAALLEGRWSPRFLDAGQLVRHALSLQHLRGRRDAHLVLLFWEPLDGGRHPEVVAHREEVADLLDRLGPDAFPRLHALDHASLFAAWEAERPRHVAALRERYAVTVA